MTNKVILDFKAPYEGTKTTYRECRKKCGVYVIRHKDSYKILYVGRGADVHKQCYSHFQQWIKRDIVFNGVAYKNVYIDREYVEVCIILTPDYYELERELIKKLDPSMNRRFPPEGTYVEKTLIVPNNLSHLDWDKINKEWNEHIKIHGQKPF